MELICVCIFSGFFCLFYFVCGCCVFPLPSSKKKTCKGNFTIKPPSGMKIEYFSQCQTNAFPLFFSPQNRYFSQTSFSILDNFNGKNILLRTFIWF